MLKINLRRYRRIREIRQLTETSDGISQVAVRLSTFERCEESGCFKLSANGKRYRRRPGTVPLTELATRPWAKDELVSFALENLQRWERYVYLLEVRHSGRIGVVFHSRYAAPRSTRWSGC